MTIVFVPTITYNQLMENTKKFAVVGHPIAHSKSPEIHQLFASQFGFALEYEKFDFSIDDFKKGVDNLKKQGFSGLNITLPFNRRIHSASKIIAIRRKMIFLSSRYFMGPKTPEDEQFPIIS